MSMRDTTGLGDVAEGVVLAELLKRGYGVARPFGVAQYDLIADVDGRLFRLQVKSGWKVSGGIEFNCSRVDRITGKRAAYANVDFFAVWTPDYDEVYWIPVDEVAVCGVTRLRREPTTNGQVKGIRWVSDYSIERIMG